MPGTLTVIVGLFEFFGYISVAEGFVFLSGYVSGLVYTRVRREQGDKAMRRKALVRARDIYLCYFLAVLLLTLLLKYGPDTFIDWGSWTKLLAGSLPLALIKAGVLLYQPTFLEILPMYCLFILLTPIILKQLELGNQIAVMIFSVIVWIAAQFGIRTALIRLIPLDIDIAFGVFNSFSWQILFVAGLLCGHKTYVTQGPWLATNLRLAMVAYILAAFFFCLRHGLLEIKVNESLVGRSSLGPLRLVNFTCVVFLIARARGVLGQFIAWRGFAFLSQHSLQVFAFHLIPVYFVGLVLGKRTSLPPSWQWLVVMFCIFSLFLIAFLAYCHKNFRFPPNA